MCLFIVSQLRARNTNQKISVSEQPFSRYQHEDLFFLGEVLRGDRIVNTNFEVNEKDIGI